MKIAVLTSSRADYSIYYPLLKALKADSFFELYIIAFGTHLSKAYGETINQICNDGFTVFVKIDTMPEADNPFAITRAMGKALINFSEVWNKESFDLVFALGDRYEMFAACASIVSFGIPIAHIHGGETTLGAIDEVFRHSITHMAKVHFTTTETYRERVAGLKNSDKNVFNVGALSIDNLKTLPLLSIDDFRRQFNIDLSVPSILITFHPETVSFEKNGQYIDALIGALREVEGYQLVITMPNADTMGTVIREKLQQFIDSSDKTIGVESFGTIAYLSCMKYASFLLGNTSSGFVEAGFFNKYVINLGERQRGRILTANIRNCVIDKAEIIRAINEFPLERPLDGSSIYGEGDTAEKIIAIIKQLHD